MRNILFRFFAFILMCALLLTNCRKSTDAIQSCYPYTIEYGAGNMNSFTYVGNHITSAVYINGGNTNTSVYVYDTQNRLSTITSGAFISTYFYDGKNRLDSIIYTGNGTVYGEDKYSYNSSDQLTQDQYFKGANQTLYYTGTYQYPNSSTHNYFSKAYFYPATNYTSTSTYTYDSKNNPYYFFRSFDPTITTNNAVTEEDSNSSTSTTTNYNFNYTYNSNGYPETVTYQSGAITYTTNYTYTNCK